MDAVEIVDGGTAVRFRAADGSPRDLHALLVRDSCRCPTCRRPSTNERLLDATTIPLDISIRSVVIDDLDGLVARFEMSDGHVVELRADEAIVAADRSALHERALWAPGHTAPIVSRAGLDHDRSRLRWLDDLVRTGLVVVDDVEASSAGLCDVAGMIGPVLPTNYETVWEVDAHLDPVSEVDSQRALRVHTDLPYRTSPPGVQLTLATVVDVDGGHSTFVDGFASAEVLRRQDPDAWRLLTTVGFEYRYDRPGVSLHNVVPMIGVGYDGRCELVRRAPDLVGTPVVDAARTADVYEALRLWDALLDDAEREVVVPLRPGRLVAFDNRRILHGRTGFELGASGRRRLIGCYLDIDELYNRRALLRRQLEFTGRHGTVVA